MPSFRQRDRTDCGAACLAFVFHHYGLNVSLAEVRRRSGTGQRGTTALGLIEAAQEAGFLAKGIRCPLVDLAHTPLPCIAHLEFDYGQHFVVLVSIGKRFVIMDPATGQTEKWTNEQFKNAWSGIIIVLAPGANFQASSHSKSAYQRIFELLIPRQEMLIQSFIGIVFTTIMSLSTTIFVQKIVDNVIADGNGNLLSLMGIAMLAVLLLRSLLNYYQGVLMLRTAQQIDASIILGYYRHLVHLPQAFFDTMRVGEITSRVADAVKIRNFLNNTLLSLLLNPLILCFSAVAMFFYSWKLALLSLALIPLNGVLFLLSSWLNRDYQRKIMERSADFEAQLVESLNAMPLVRAFQLEERMAVISETRLVRLLRTVWTASRLGLSINVSGGIVNQAYTIALLWIGTNEVLHARLTPGELMSCYTLAGYFTGPLLALIGINANIQEALIATDRLYEIIDLDRESDPGTLDLDSTNRADIRIEGLTFAYRGRMPVLNNVSCTIKHGKITALVGPSGSGKSTLLALLQRLYVPEKGRILVGDIDLRHVRLASLRRMIAVVPQHTTLLSGTLRENLAPGDPVPDMARLIQLCRQVGILEFIESLAANFDTLLTENGSNLSGGQRQRIAIVRALYTGAEVILLDEPTSALDREATQALARLLIELREYGRTIVLSTHDLALVEYADHAVRFHEGSCVADRSFPAGAEAERRNTTRVAGV